MLRGIMWSWSQETGGFFCDKTLHELWPPRRNAESDGQWSAAVRIKGTEVAEPWMWTPSSMLCSILRKLQAPPYPSFNYPASWVNSSSLSAASADRIILHMCFEGWLSSLLPSETRWSDPVYMQTYRLTLPFTAIQSFLLTPSTVHQSDGASPSLPSRSWSFLCQPPDSSIHLSLINGWCCQTKVIKKFSNLKMLWNTIQ